MLKYYTLTKWNLHKSCMYITVMGETNEKTEDLADVVPGFNKLCHSCFAWRTGEPQSRRRTGVPRLIVLSHNLSAINWERDFSWFVIWDGFNYSYMDIVQIEQCLGWWLFSRITWVQSNEKEAYFDLLYGRVSITHIGHITVLNRHCWTHIALCQETNHPSCPSPKTEINICINWECED